MKKNIKQIPKQITHTVKMDKPVSIDTGYLNELKSLEFNIDGHGTKAEDYIFLREVKTTPNLLKESWKNIEKHYKHKERLNNDKN